MNLIEEDKIGGICR